MLCSQLGGYFLATSVELPCIRLGVGWQLLFPTIVELPCGEVGGQFLATMMVELPYDTAGWWFSYNNSRASLCTTGG